jgi:hypothetical protein
MKASSRRPCSSATPTRPLPAARKGVDNAGSTRSQPGHEVLAYKEPQGWSGSQAHPKPRASPRPRQGNLSQCHAFRPPRRTRPAACGREPTRRVPGFGVVYHDREGADVAGLTPGQPPCTGAWCRAQCLAGEGEPLVQLDDRRQRAPPRRECHTRVADLPDDDPDLVCLRLV